MKRLCLFGVFAALVLMPFMACTIQAQEAKEDFSKRGRGHKPLTPERRAQLHAASVVKHGGRLAMLAKFKGVPAAFDCRDKGWVLPVGDQGNCGSCFLYSTIYGTLSQCFVRAGYGKADGSFVMSVQYGMDCHDFGGCNGGNGTEVIDWVCKNGWPAEKWVDVDGSAHNDYPAYSASSRACRKVPGAKLWKPADWGFVAASQNRPATTLEIKTALVNYGPLNVSLDAGGQFGNGTGTITSLGNSIDHEIELVAYDDNHDNGDGTKGAFLLKNQWDTSWGIGGYRWVSYTAAQHLVDVFFVTAGQLPPPPPVPPVPPAPVPPGPTPKGNTITVNVGGKVTVYKVLTADQEKALREIFDPQPVEAEPPLIEKTVPMPPAKTIDPFGQSFIRLDAPAKWLTYQEGIELAESTGRDLYVYVGVGCGANDNAIVCHAPKLTGFPPKCIVLCRRINGTMHWQATYAPTGERIDPPLSRAALSYSAPAVC